MAIDPSAPQWRVSLRALAMDLRWTWVPAMRRPFEMLDPATWEWSNHSPLAVLSRVDDAALTARLGDPDFAAACIEAARATPSIAGECAGESAAGGPGTHPAKAHIAYFCSEFALHESMAQYAGGLGVLAGDHLKAAADAGLPLVGVGLLYSEGYFRQEFARDGASRSLAAPCDLSTLPMEETGISIACPVGRRRVKARVWRARLGSVSLYLLDANLRANRPEDRALTAGLYRGEPTLRLRQQVLLGVGGMLALEALGERPSVIHLNEGHAAFAAVALLSRRLQEGLAWDAAVGSVRQSVVFTTHTPVPAGHDRYPMRETLSQLRGTLRMGGITAAQFAGLSRERPTARGTPCCMTALCIRLARAVNGVSELHAKVSREMWKEIRLVDGGAPEIFGITNGVHASTWIDPIAADFWHAHAGIDASRAQGWERATSVSPEAFWGMRDTLRARLVHFTRVRLARQAVGEGLGPEEVAERLSWLDPGALTICFARRFATYKRATLLLRDPDRLARLLGDTARPMQVIFAGKAHPRDTGGQSLAREIHQAQEDPRFRGRLVLLSEYDMHVGRMLTSGCDLWLNTPVRPNEASGTSGMKPPLHGGINLSVLDGWWPEAADGTNGWSIPGTRGSDEEDAESLYELLEREVVPAFFERDALGLPRTWIERALRSAATVPPRFNAARMLADYERLCYAVQPR